MRSREMAVKLRKWWPEGGGRMGRLINPRLVLEDVT
jgi:hypothetical protein